MSLKLKQKGLSKEEEVDNQVIEGMESTSLGTRSDSKVCFKENSYL